MSESPSVPWAAVVVNHDAGQILARCIGAVLADDALGPAQVVVVDNASTDGSADAIEARFPQVTVVRSPRNLGYARAANLGIAVTDAAYVAVLNPDTFLTVGTGPAMVDVLASHPEVGAVGPTVRNTDGTVYPSARSQPKTLDAIGHGLLGWWWPRNPFTRRYRQLDADPQVGRDVDWLSGCALWLRREALDQVGGWDERYFMYMEDVDLGNRLRRLGWRVRYEPTGTVEHLQGVSTARHPYRMIAEHHRSMLRFARAHYRGARRLLLPAVGLYLALRCALTWSDHLFRSRGWARRERS